MFIFIAIKVYLQYENLIQKRSQYIDDVYLILSYKYDLHGIEITKHHSSYISTII